MTFLEKYAELPAEKQTRLKKFIVISGFLVVALSLYYLTGNNEKAPVVVTQEKDIRLSEGLLEDDITVKVESQLGETHKLVSELTKRIVELEGKYNTAIHQLGEATSLLETKPDGAFESRPTAAPEMTFPPAPQTQYEPGATLQIEEAVAGGIGHVVGASKEVTLKNEPKTIRLPPGFMEGTLLTGVEADALTDGAGDPEPIMIRIDRPTVLPNRLRADLKGCFVIASAHGKINRERVEARLVSLHCVRKNGFSAVEAELKGYVADQDGKKGMAGIVVSKAGPLILRSSIAGAIVGAGDAISQGSSTTTITGSGAVSTYDGDEIAKSAIGGGIARGSEQLNKVFLEYIKQTTPVIEVGTQKQITVCITEPVTLKIIEADEFAGL